MAPAYTPSTTAAKPTVAAAPAPRVDDRMVNDANQSGFELSLMTDAITDKLEWAVHRTGLTPRLKALMAALKHFRDIGPIKFDQATKHPMMTFLGHSMGSPLRVFTPNMANSDYALPTPFSTLTPKFPKKKS